jgi:hypothetical protein
MHVVIDLFGDEDVIKVPQEDDPSEVKKRELARRHVLEEIFRRAPQPQVVPVEHGR